MSTNVNNITRVPRLLNDYIVYDNVQNNSLVYVTSDGSYKEIIADRGLLVKDANDSVTSPTFKSYTGILYYSNNQLTSSDELTANNILFVNNSSRLEQITTSVNENNNEINEGVLTTYEFNDKQVTQGNTVPKFSSQFVLNNAEVTDGNQRIEDPYLIYGKGINNGGLSFINASDDTYNFISVDNTNGVIQMSNINDVFNDLGSVDTNTSFKIVAIDANEKVSLITADTINEEGNYVLYNENNNLQFKELTDAFGTVTPSELELNTEQYFDYTKDDLIAQNDNDKFVVAPHSNTTLTYPYFTGENGEYWKDLSKQPFLTISNTNTINNVINKFYPVVVNTDDKNIYTVNNLEPAYYVLNANNSTYYNYANLFNISDSYISGGNLQIANYNSGVNLGTTETLFNLSNVLCFSNSTIFQNKGNVNTSGILQIGTDENIKVNNTIIPNITDLQSTSNTHTAQISQLNTASNVFATQITNLSTSKCVINEDRNSIINISNILTNNSSDPTKIIRGHISYNSGVMYLDNSKNINVVNPSPINSALISTSNGYMWTQITTQLIADDAVTNVKIASNSITDAKIFNETITSNSIAVKAITGDRLADKTITGDRLADKTITGDQIANNTVNGYNIAQRTIGDDNIGFKQITTPLIDDNAVNTSQIANNAVTNVKIANNSVTGSKLNFNGSQPSGSWNNILINNSNQLIKTNATVTNYGVFTNTGTVTNLDASVLNSVGLKFFTPTDDEGKIDESSYLATRFIVYTSNSGNIIFKPNFVSFLKYNEINNFDKSIICDYISNVNNNVLDKSLNGESSNTVSILYKNILNQQKDNEYVYNGKYLNFKTLLHIDSIQLSNAYNTNAYSYDTNSNSHQYSIANLKSDNLTLIIGVYTNLYPNQYNSENRKYNDIIFLNSKIVMYHNTILDIRETLLGYILINLNDVDNSGNITLNKDYEFNSSIIINNSNFAYYTDGNSTNTLNNVYNNIISFRPLFYLKNNNITDIRSLYYNLPQSGNPTSTFLDNLSYSNNNGVVSYSYNNNNISLTDVFYQYEVDTNITYAKGVLCFPKPLYKLDNRTLIISDKTTIYTFDTVAIANTYYVFSDDKYIYVGGLSSQPIESEMNINVNPVTTYSNIQFTLNNPDNTVNFTVTPSNYKFSIFDINLSITDYVGEYPSIIQ